MHAVSNQTEAWLLGPVDGCPDGVMPVAHALLQARRELVFLRGDISEEEVRADPGGAAPIGFHLVHIAGSLDRLFTYARGESLDPDQLAELRREAESGRTRAPEDLFVMTLVRLDRCLETLQATSDDLLSQPRTVGRGQLPSTVRGLLFHAAEHTTMHIGQIRTTLKNIRGRGQRTTGQKDQPS